MNTEARVPCLESQGLHIPNNAVIIIVNRCKLCKGEIHRKCLTSETIIFDGCTCPHYLKDEEHIAWIVDGQGTMAIWDEKNIPALKAVRDERRL